MAGDPEIGGRSASAAVGSLVFLVLIPGTMGGLIPWWITGWQAQPVALAAQIAGVVLLAAGLAVLLDAFVRFAFEGRGTPAPIAPTEQLVVGGVYRHVRNPMYVAVTRNRRWDGATATGTAPIATTSRRGGRGCAHGAASRRRRRVGRTFDRVRRRTLQGPGLRESRAAGASACREQSRRGGRKLSCAAREPLLTSQRR